MLRGVYRRLSALKPSSVALAAVAIAIAIFLFGGGLYLVIVKPFPAVYYGGRFLFIYPQLSEQWVSDSIIAMTLFAFGTTGLLLIYRSTKYAYNSRQAYLVFLMGALLILISYISMEAILHYLKGV
jgi:hypothetical protein